MLALIRLDIEATRPIIDIGSIVELHWIGFDDLLLKVVSRL